MPVPYYDPWNPLFEYASRHALLHGETGAIISYIPKNACSSIKASMLMHQYGYEEQEFLEIASPAIHSVTHLLQAKPQDIARAKKSYILFRDPIERAVSVFLDKFVSGLQESVKFANLVIDMGLDDAEDEVESRQKRIIDDLTFKSFLELLRHDRLLKLDPHWRPQRHFVMFKNYTHRGIMSDMPSFIEAIESDMGIKWLDSRGFMKHGREQYEKLDTPELYNTRVADLAYYKNEIKVVPSTASMLSPEIINLISEIYRQDFEYLSNNLNYKSKYI